MFPVGLILTLSLAIGVLTQSCDVGGFTIDDIRDTVTVTNTSTSQDAFVHLSTSLGKVDTRLAAGTSATYGVLAATKYRIDVWAPTDPSGVTYRQSLLDLREELVDLSINPRDSFATPESVVAQLLLVQSALKELHGSKSVQTCSASINPDGNNTATITWTQPTGTGFWVLGCG
jgi:hypothetical protein